MKTIEMQKFGLEELSKKEMMQIEGGKTVICLYDGDNELTYAINTFFNAVKYVKHWILNDDLYVTTIHDDGTRDAETPFNN